MAQAPTFSLADPFNPEYFTDPYLTEHWPEMTEAERTYQVNRLWRNYHITGSSEPGSVFKPFVIAAAIEEGVITRNFSTYCEGVRIIAEMEVPCHNEWGCRSISLRRALYRSCNLAMATINRMMGRYTFYDYRGYFGFGERTGIDFPGEDAVSHHTVMYPLSHLNAVEMATSSMGQGFNATTIQLINGYAALINGGILRQPHFVSQIVDINGNPVYTRDTQQFVRRVISEETSEFMRTEMRYVISNTQHIPPYVLRGTGRLSYIAGHDIGGKTGTAQQGVRADGIHNLSFVTFLPVGNPRYLVLMTIDRIEDGTRSAGDTVAPIMREFLLDLIRIRNIPAVGEVEPTVDDLAGAVMPDFAGHRLAEAVNTAIDLQAAGFQASGGGTIISHTWPLAGHLIPENSPIIFYTDPDTRLAGRMIAVPDVVGLTAEIAVRVLEDAGLTPVLVAERPPTPEGADSEPRTFIPEPVGEDFVPPPALPYTVHLQFPAPGTEIEQGTQAVLHAR
jgi:stage V sporulation protein D (sporulation-specific penicillin-binding protein)